MADLDPLAMLLGQPDTGGMAPGPAPSPVAPPAGDVRDTGTGGWTSWLQNPANRAFLISAGAQMLQPSFAGGMANMGQALAQGEEARSGTIRTQQDMDFARDQMDQRSREGAATRANQLRVAEIGAESRLDVAHIRSNAMLQRAQLIGARSTGAVNQFSNLVARFYANLSRDNPVAGTGRMTSDQLYDRALQMAEDAMRAQHGSMLTPDGAPRTPGAPTPSPGTATPPPGSRTTAPPATTTPPTVPAAPTQVIPGQGGLRFMGPLGVLTEQLLRRAPAGTGIPPSQTPQLDPAPAPGSSIPQTTPGASRMTFEQFMQQPGAQALIRDPARRARIIAANPTWAAQINAMVGGQ